MILASISGGQSLGKPLSELSRQGQSLCERPFSVSCRRSKPFKPSDAVGFDEKSRIASQRGGVQQQFDHLIADLGILMPGQEAQVEAISQEWVATIVVPGFGLRRLPGLDRDRLGVFR